MFGIDQVPIHNDVEDAAAALDQFGLNARCILDRVRQTGGLRGVVSLHAVSNADFHPETLRLLNLKLELPETFDRLTTW